MSIQDYNHQSRNPLYHILWGVRFFFWGMRTLVRNLDLLSLSIFPMLLAMLLLLGLIFGAAWMVGRLIGDAHIEARIVAQVLTILLTLFIAFFLYIPVARALLAPFAEALSRRTHTINTGDGARQVFLRKRGWRRVIWEPLKLALFQTVIALIALVLGWAIPPIGAVIGIVVWIFLVCLNLLDIPLSIRGLRLQEKLGMMWRNKSLALGFGAAAYLTLLIPVLNMLALPIGVVGATLLIDALEFDGNI